MVFNKLLRAKCGASATAWNLWELHSWQFAPLSGSFPRPAPGAREKTCRQRGRPEGASLWGADLQEINGHCRKSWKP